MRLSVSKGQICVAFSLVAILTLSACGGGREEQPEAASSTPLVERGAALYQANCLKCHGGATGGKLKDIPPPHNTNGHTWHHADQQLTEMTLKGIAFSAEAKKMPAFKDLLSEEDVQAVLAYIKTWWTEEQRERQRKATENWGR